MNSSEAKVLDGNIQHKDNSHTLLSILTLYYDAALFSIV